MICSKQKFGHWHASLQVPFYWLERNHIVIPTLQTEIEETVAEITGVPTDEVDQYQQEEFQNAHFISDKLGFGDLRFMIDHPVFKNSYWTMRVGGLMTVPTAIAVQRGLRGSKFCRLFSPPLLDFCLLFTSLTSETAAFKNAAIQTASNYFLAALDNLNAILLDTPLGNNGHLELGVYMKNKFPVSMYIAQPWARRLIWRSFSSVQYQLPAWETRSFILPVDLAEFYAQNFNVTGGTDIENAVNAIQSYNFLIQQLTERLFPIARDARVHPSWIFRNTSHLCYEAPKGGFVLGSDTWIRAGEKITAVQATPDILERISICTAEASFAYQAKVFGSVFFKKERPGQVWAVGLSGDYTYWSKGIGQDYSLMINADVTF